MGFRFQRRIQDRVLRVRLNLSKSGIGGSVGRTGLRLGLDAKRRKYFSVGLPGTGLSYCTFFGRPVAHPDAKESWLFSNRGGTLSRRVGHSGDPKGLIECNERHGLPAHAGVRLLLGNTVDLGPGSHSTDRMPQKRPLFIRKVFFRLVVIRPDRSGYQQGKQQIVVS